MESESQDQIALVELIKRKAADLGYSQQKLADKAGISPSIVSRVFNAGRGIALKNLMALLNAVGVFEDSISGATEILGGATTQVPVISWIRAGALHEAIDPWPVGVSGEQERVSTGKQAGGNAFALRIEGDSMYPRYMPGDIIIIDPEISCESGDDCVICLNGEVTFKKFKETEDEIRLIPLNEKYEDRVIPKNRKIDFQVIGKVIDMKPKL